ncbi:hypothetical protein Fcan01_19917 [Folsomia candida]|uniref:Uncharacterized protein n=1 Tax=Folsomia candida TaxID=158441 RepID=A0A226DIF0_FOLCA|nr:hypothetical protein Fcan01_19917 [Folsomia candida]
MSNWFNSKATGKSKNCNTPKPSTPKLNDPLKNVTPKRARNRDPTETSPIYEKQTVKRLKDTSDNSNSDLEYFPAMAGKETGSPSDPLPITRADLEELFSKSESRIRKIITDELKPIKDRVTDELKKVNSTLETVQRAEKRNNIIVRGIKESENENYRDRDNIVDQLCKTMKISKLDYDYAIRVGRKRPDYTRPLLVRCLRSHEKSNLMSSRKKLKGSSIFVNHDLTHTQRQQQAALRSKKLQLEKEKPNVQCTILTGKMRVKIGENVSIIYAEDLISDGSFQPRTTRNDTHQEMTLG